MELVIVVVIIGIIAAIAIPRLNRGSGSAGESALAANLSALRAAIEYYRAEHHVYPTCNPLPGGETTIMLQLTQYSDDAGNVSKTRDTRYRYGPYIQAIPPMTVTYLKGSTKISATDGPRVAWLYDPTTGTISANTAGIKDSSGTKLYSDY
jgi:general secretion pathway protein G